MVYSKIISLQLTKANGDWMPRLERMAASRKLCDFEKNVLLLLIGSVLQSNKVCHSHSTSWFQCFHSRDSSFQFQNYEIRIAPNFAQVGEVLRIFCDDLEEQIQHRKYFYKSSTLVREGMVVVHSTGLTGDPSTATVRDCVTVMHSIFHHMYLLQCCKLLQCSITLSTGFIQCFFS